MEIVRIFAARNELFAVHYSNEKHDELKRLLLLWNDVSYLNQFLIQNKSDIPKGKTITQLVRQIIDNANEIDDTLYNLILDESMNIDSFFKPLNNNEYKILELWKQKGRNNYLRIYALRIDTNCYLITGGAIKFTRIMDDRPHTKKELNKIEKCRNYLLDNNVTDEESFLNFLN